MTVISFAVVMIKLKFGMCDCTVDSDVGKDAFLLCWGFCMHFYTHICNHACLLA